MGLPVPTGGDEGFLGLEDILSLDAFNDLQPSAADSRCTSESLVPTLPLWLDHGAQHPQQPPGSHQELPNTPSSSNLIVDPSLPRPLLDQETFVPPNHAWDSVAFLSQDPSALDPVFTSPQGPSSAVTSYQYLTTEEYGERWSSYDPSHLPSYLSLDGTLYHYPPLGDGSGSDRQELLSAQRLPELEPTSEAILSPSRQAKRTRASSEATDSRTSDDSDTNKRQRISDKKGQMQYTHYVVGQKHPQKPSSSRPLISISSHQVGSAELELVALEEFRQRVRKAYPNKATDIANLQYKPAPKVDTQTHLVDNGITVEQTRARLTEPFRKRVKREREQRAPQEAPLGTLRRLHQEMKRAYDVDGYSIMFYKYTPKKGSNFLTFSVVARRSVDEDDQKIWVGDIAIPRSIWESEGPPQPTSEMVAQRQQAPSAP
ncbi:hypothetical protein ACQY0O_003425 [Thecaphora frezii]